MLFWHMMAERSLVLGIRVVDHGNLGQQALAQTHLLLDVASRVVFGVL